MKFPWTKEEPKSRKRSRRVRGVYDLSAAGGYVYGPDGKKYDLTDAAGMYGVLEPPNESIRSALKELRRLSRVEAARGGYLRSAVLSFRREVVGKGIHLHSMHPDEDVRNALENAWNKWTKDPEVTGQMSFRALLHAAITSLIVDGEILLRERAGEGEFGYQLELLDTMLLDIDKNDVSGEQKTIMGVRLNSFRRPVEYWIKDFPPGAGYDYGSTGTTRRTVPAKDVIHVFDAEMPMQIRGIPWAFATLKRFAQIRDYDNAEREAAKLGASVFAVHKPTETGDADLDEEANKDPLQVKNGEVLDLDPGSDMDFHTPQHPNRAYGDYVMSNLTAAAASLGISYASLTQDLSRANFVSSRMGRMAEMGTIEMIRQLLEERLLYRVFNNWLPLAYAKGMIDTRVKVSELENVRFQGKGPEHVQIREQAAAAELYLKNDLKSHSELIRESGRDPMDVFQEIAQDKAIMKELGIKEEMPDIFGDDEESEDEAE